jgi:hypothetical protein
MDRHSTICGATYIEFDCIAAHLTRTSKSSERVFPLRLGCSPVGDYLRCCHVATCFQKRMNFFLKIHH